MKLLIILCIVLFVFPVFPGFKQTIYAQQPVLLDKNLEKEGITIPVPTTSVSDEAVTAQYSASQQIQYGSNYYPDQGFSEDQTKLLLIIGLLCLFFGTLLVTGKELFQFLLQSRKKDPLILLRHFGHNI